MDSLCNSQTKRLDIVPVERIEFGAAPNVAAVSNARDDDQYELVASRFFLLLAAPGWGLSARKGGNIHSITYSHAAPGFWCALRARADCNVGEKDQ